MANGKYSNRKASHVKPLVLLLTLALVVGCAVGGTIAWLTDKTEEVVNTFTVGNIDIELDETTGEEYKMIPGFTIDKDPFVTVKAGSEKSYVFIEVTESENFGDYMSYDIDSAWTPVPGTTNVYYLIQNATTADVVHEVLKDDQVKVKDTVTKQMMDAIAEGTADEPTLTFTAYAVQYNESNNDAFTPAEAWAIAKPAANS